MSGVDASAERAAFTILLVEDQEAVCTVISRALRARGYEVIAASSAEAALSAAAGYDGPIDLLVTDVVLSDLTGVELCRRLRQKGLVHLTLFMSGYSRDQLTLTASAEFLQKPFTIDGILGAVAELVARSSRPEPT